MDFSQPAFSSAHIHRIGSSHVLKMHIRPMKSRIKDDVTLSLTPISPSTSKSNGLNISLVLIGAVGLVRAFL